MEGGSEGGRRRTVAGSQGLGGGVREKGVGRRKSGGRGKYIKSEVVK